MTGWEEIASQIILTDEDGYYYMPTDDGLPAWSLTEIDAKIARDAIRLAYEAIEGGKNA